MPCSLGTNATLTVPPAAEPLAPGAAVWFFLVHAPMAKVRARAMRTTAVILSLDCTAPPCSPRRRLKLCGVAQRRISIPRYFWHPVITPSALARVRLAPAADRDQPLMPV